MHTRLRSIAISCHLHHMQATNQETILTQLNALCFHEMIVTLLCLTLVVCFYVLQFVENRRSKFNASVAKQQKF